MIYEGGEIVGKTLKSAGVKHVFGLVGHGNIALIDGIDREGIDFISCHHETIAGMAADAYFRSTGKPGVVCLTCAPGALNAQLAISAAAADHSAVVYIVGDIPEKFAGKGTYEETDLNGPADQFNLLRPLFKRSWKVTRLNLLSEYIANAFNVAQSGCPGPVLLDIPFDLGTERSETQIVNVESRRPLFNPEGASHLVEQAAKLLVNAQSPVLFAGGGVNISRASEEVIALSELLDAPIITSIIGSCSFPGTLPNLAGFVGSYGVKIANDLARTADVLLAIGTRFEEEETAIWLDGEVFNIPPTKVIHIDIDPMQIGKNYQIEVGIVGDAKSTLAKLITVIKKELGNGKRKRDRIKKLQKMKKAWMEELKPYINSTEIPIQPRRILKELEELFPDNGILLVDPSWARIGLLQQFATPGKDKCYIIGGLLPIGWSTAGALGAAVGRSGSRVIALTGDGGFLLNIQSVLTAVEYDLPITWLIIDNQGYNALDVLQKAYFGKSIGSKFEKAGSKEPCSPDYAAIARAFGALGERIEKPEDIRPSLERALNSDEPFVLDFISSAEGSRLVRSAPVTWEYFWTERRKRLRKGHK